jgi:hypothetical protein
VHCGEGRKARSQLTVLIHAELPTRVVQSDLSPGPWFLLTREHRSSVNEGPGERSPLNSAPSLIKTKAPKSGALHQKTAGTFVTRLLFAS